MIITLNVNIQAPELANAIQSIAGALAVTKAGTPHQQTPAMEKTSKTTPAAKKTTPSVEETPATEEAATPEDAPATEEIPTVVELRAKAQEKATTAEGKKAVKALLDKFESKSISDVPEEKRAAFFKELEEL